MSCGHMLNERLSQIQQNLHSSITLRKWQVYVLNDENNKVSERIPKFRTYPETEKQDLEARAELCSGLKKPMFTDFGIAYFHELISRIF